MVFYYYFFFCFSGARAQLQYLSLRVNHHVFHETRIDEQLDLTVFTYIRRRRGLWDDNIKKRFMWKCVYIISCDRW